MDPISQGVVGGILAQSFAGKGKVRAAAIIGFISGLLADLDVLIRSSNDPLLFLEYHRHFTHSLAFVPIGALFGVICSWIFVRSKVSLLECYKFAFLGYLTHGLLDSCTSYGTLLFWPFLDTRVAWNNISIIDPIFTGVLLVAMTVSLFRNSKRIAVVGSIYGLLYLSLGILQRDKAEIAIAQLAQSRGHETVRISAKPSFGNIILWRGIYETKDTIFVDGINVGFFGQAQAKIFPGSSAKKVTLAADFQDIPRDSVLWRDLERFAFFSDYYLGFHPEDPSVLADLRYSILPNSILPLWGIKINPEYLDRHVEYVTFRRIADRNWKEFWGMIVSSK